MGRKAKPAPEIMTVDVDDEQIAQDMIAVNQLAVMNTEREAMTRAVAAQMGYQLPADCTDPDLICRDISANMRRSVEACLEVGKGLRVLKEACGHGEYSKRLDVLGIDRAVSWKFIQAATKFSNVSTSKHLTKALGNQSKLFEMLILDDEQLEELELTGQTGELALDAVATMSVKELRAALRETRADYEAKSKILADKNAKIDELSEKLSVQKTKRVKTLPPEDIGKEIREEVVRWVSQAEVGIRALKTSFEALAEHTEASGISHADFASGLVGQLQLALNQLRGAFDIKDAPDGELLPEWMREGAEEKARERVAKDMATNGWMWDEAGQMVRIPGFDAPTAIEGEAAEMAELVVAPSPQPSPRGRGRTALTLAADADTSDETEA